MTVGSGEIPIEPLSTSARSFAVNGAQVGWLVGAGASASGGVPTAGQLLDEFKAILYASQCNLDRARIALADPLVAERIRRYFAHVNASPSFLRPPYAASDWFTRGRWMS